MGKRIYLLTAVLLISFSACSDKKNKEESASPSSSFFHYVSSVKQSDSRNILSEFSRMELPEYPAYGGTVSHHLLAAGYIDSWFRLLKSRQEIKTFILISPDHFDKSYQYLAVSKRPWFSEDGIIETDTVLADRILEEYSLREETAVFDQEHGIGVLVRYIIKYFPESRIVPITQKENIFRKRKLDDLVSLIQKEIDEDEKYFVLVSIDFSHYEDLEETEKRDAFSEYYLVNQWNEEMKFPVCDNMGGLYVLNRLHGHGQKSHIPLILKHINSWEISGKLPENITSYFFTLYF